MIIEGISKLVDTLIDDPLSMTLNIFLSAIVEIVQTTFETMAYIAVGSILGQFVDDWLEQVWGEDKSMEEFTTASLTFKLFVHVAGVLLIRSLAIEYFTRFPSPFTGRVGSGASAGLFYAAVAYHSPHLESDADEVIKRVSSWLKDLSKYLDIRNIFFYRRSRRYRRHQRQISSLNPYLNNYDYYSPNTSTFSYNDYDDNYYNNSHFQNTMYDAAFPVTTYNELGIAQYPKNFHQNKLFQTLFTL